MQVKNWAGDAGTVQLPSLPDGNVELMVHFGNDVYAVPEYVVSE